MPIDQANKTKVLDDIVYGVFMEMSRPIKITKNTFIKILKTHRGIDVTENQLRGVFDRLMDSAKITTFAEGIFTVVKVLTDMDEMIFSQPLKHKNHNTPPNAYVIINQLKKFGVGANRNIPMKEMAHKIKTDDQSQASVERATRGHIDKLMDDTYVKQNGMPFEMVIMSETNPVAGNGYYLVSNDEEADKWLKKQKSIFLKQAKKYWIGLRRIEKNGQLRIRSTEHERAMFKSISDDFKIDPDSYADSDDL